MKRSCSQCQNQSLQSLISKFHNIVSQGPLYIICSCSDQLWYRHNVLPAETLKKTNPGIETNLHKTSVDNLEWLCRTFCNHLVKNKVPPCSAINGMQFPAKPILFT